MPLSFQSQTHGNIAFGFFNIESDMLLLENHFFFASDFCEWISKMAEQENAGQKRVYHPVYHIADPNDIGDLMGAIHGVRFQGFIGRVYTLFPFPEDPKAFKQNPDGYQTQKIVISLIEGVSEKTEILIEFSESGQVHIGPYVFEKNVFFELIRYVWQGGYPCWKDEIRPPYVIKMKERIQKSCNPFLKGVFSS
ncbi:MAG: hypothetical protein KKE61_02565 [Proteobacteria bacterium]|nr:hypothetical protein [Pseudomonadota bacterium]